MPKHDDIQSFLIHARHSSKTHEIFRSDLTTTFGKHSIIKKRDLRSLSLQSPTMASSKRNKDEHYRDIFRQFCESSTVHGTFFWHAADTVFAKAMWVVVVLAGETYQLEFSHKSQS